MEYTKLNALQTLGNAYWYLIGGSGPGALIIVDAFHKVRRSLTLDDIETYTEHRAEGYNGKMSTFF